MLRCRQPILHCIWRLVRRPFVGQGFQKLHQIIELLFVQMAGLAVLVLFIARRQHVVKRVRFAVVQIRRRVIDAQQRGRVVRRPHLFRRIVFTGAHVAQFERLLQAAVGVIGAAVAMGTTYLVAEEKLFASLRPSRELARPHDVGR